MASLPHEPAFDDKPASIVSLDRRLSRAMEKGRGIMLTAADVDLMAALGVSALIDQSKTKFLKDQALWRNARRRSIPGGNTGSDGTKPPTAAADRPTSPSSGPMTPPEPDEGLAALQRARLISRKG